MHFPHSTGVYSLGNSTTTTTTARGTALSEQTCGGEELEK
jgi:hypothetical protein